MSNFQRRAAVWGVLAVPICVGIACNLNPQPLPPADELLPDASTPFMDAGGYKTPERTTSDASAAGSAPDGSADALNDGGLMPPPQSDAGPSDAGIADADAGDATND